MRAHLLNTSTVAFYLHYGCGESFRQAGGRRECMGGVLYDLSLYSTPLSPSTPPISLSLTLVLCHPLTTAPALPRDVIIIPSRDTIYTAE